LVVVWNRRGISSLLTLEKGRKENGDEPSSDQKFLPVTDTKVASV
jgi:hypothetical protein